jgi:ATP-dependent exoDNAse (exonuclease V) beta subunit
MSAAPAFTDEDARARIHSDLDSTLFVEAGAGTGKTRELIERLIALVSSGRTELRSIAAITFTEAAAAELRDRVRIRLEEAARDESFDEEQKERCQTAIGQLDAAAIETLHAFAQRLLTDHPLEAGLPPLIEVQDEIRSSIAFEERWRDFVDELLDDKTVEPLLLRAFVLGGKPDDILNSLRGVAQEFHEHWDRLEDIEIKAAPLPPVDLSLLTARLGKACESRSTCITQADALYQHVERLVPYHRRLAEADADLDRLRILAESVKIAPGRAGRASNWRSVDAVRDDLSDVARIRNETLAGARAALLPALLSELRRFILDYAEERRRAGRLEFHDLLVQARDLLRKNDDVRRAIRERFTHLLIDEFQDTDPLQIEIAALIASEDATHGTNWYDAPIDEGRLFFVGDPKQSIYRFRRADIDLYQRAQGRFERGLVRLTENFRSVPPVLAWVNRIFGELMGEEPAEGQVAYVPLAPSRADVAAPTVRVLGGPKRGDLFTIRRNEAREIARLIQCAKEEGWQVVVDGEQRAARYDDIALLLPTRTPLPPIEQALEDAGIPYRVESRSLVYDTQEVRELLSILRAIDDPTDQVALIAALRSPAFGCADDELLRYSQAKGRWDYRSHAPEGLPEDDPVVVAMASLRDLHERRWWETISGIVESVIRERRLFELAFAHRRPRERWQRLRFVLDQSRALAEAGGRTLRQFIDWAERQAGEGTRVVETVVPEPDDDAVRVMTVHAAKGLEFPIVILAGLNLQAASQPRNRPVLWGAAGQPEVTLGSKFESPGYDALSQREAQMDTQEKVRLLYVAATRARDHLVVSLHHEQGKHSHAEKLSEICADAKKLWQKAEVSMQLTLSPDGTSRKPFDDSAERRDAWFEARQQRIETLRRVPAYAATELAKLATEAIDDPNLEKDPPVEEVPPWRRGRAGTAIGRAVHAVLQSIDLASGDALDGAARAQAAAEGIPTRADEVARLVSSALRSSAVQEAVASGRYWRELYAGAPVGGTVIEGFIDLLYETPDGLVVVDYKTDAVPGAREIDAAVERYRWQGAAYAVALEQSLGRPVARCVFVFARPSGALEREIEDLPAAKNAVRALLQELKPGLSAQP